MRYIKRIGILRYKRPMKFNLSLTLFCLIISLQGLASINPSRTVTPLLDIYGGTKVQDGLVKVSVTTHTGKGELTKKGSHQLIPSEFFETLKAWSSPVFRMLPADRGQDETRMGTAFHIGHDLVLTNQHVLDPTRKNLTECKDFRIVDHSGKSFACEKIIFCKNPDDICLIKMKPSEPSCPIFCKDRKRLAEGPSARIRASYVPTPNEEAESIITVIGNSMGLGIHVSQGRGVRLSVTTRDPYAIHFYAPATKGNSGGAIFDETGVVVGLVKQQSGLADKSIINPVGDHTFNIALRVERILELSREALKNDPETLEQFNEAVIE
jgi:S1-C subfamily serine protease